MESRRYFIFFSNQGDSEFLKGVKRIPKMLLLATWKLKPYSQFSRKNKKKLSFHSNRLHEVKLFWKLTFFKNSWKKCWQNPSKSVILAQANSFCIWYILSFCFSSSENFGLIIVWFKKPGGRNFRKKWFKKKPYFQKF